MKLTTTELRTRGGRTAVRVGETLETAVITKNGRPIAAIVPIEALDIVNREEVAAELRALRQARLDLRRGDYVTIEELRETLYGSQKIRSPHSKKSRKGNRRSRRAGQKTPRR